MVTLELGLQVVITDDGRVSVQLQHATPRGEVAEDADPRKTKRERDAARIRVIADGVSATIGGPTSEEAAAADEEPCDVAPPPPAPRPSKSTTTTTTTEINATIKTTQATTVLVRRLAALGVDDATAASVLQTYPAGRVADVCTWVERLKSSQPVASPAALLTSTLRRNPR